MSEPRTRTKYTYDGRGLRVKKCLPNCTSPSSYTTYVFSGSKVIAEYDNGAAVGSPSREYIYSGSSIIAKIDSSGTKYYHQDHHSNRLVTDSSGNTFTQMGHFPFGESWYNTTGDKLLFTSYERDSESGNDYAMARYNMSRLGRFSSPDPLAGSMADPQTLNRYAYVRNDTLSLIDPTGLLLAPPAAGGGCDASLYDCYGPGGPVDGGGGGFGPGYLMQTMSPLALLLGAEAQYVAGVNYTIEATGSQRDSSYKEALEDFTIIQTSPVRPPARSSVQTVWRTIGNTVAG